MSKGTTKQRVAPRLHFAAPHVEDFKDWLRANGYRQSTIVEAVRLLAGWTDWMHHAGYGLDTMFEGHAASIKAFTGKKSIRRYASSGALFIRYLLDRELLPRMAAPPSPTQTWPILSMFRQWMREHRGVADATLDNWQRDLIALLETLGDDPHAYTALAIRRFVRRRCKPFGIGRAKSVGVATRVYLRFLIATKQCPPGRDHAVPSFANWQLAEIPRHLPAEDVERVIAACSGEHWLRDRAIVLLLARLGLRAGEVAKLKLTDIDWRNGRLAISSSKSKRADWLPLTQEVGNAIIAYLERARPRQRTPRLFLTEFAPTRPITRITVKCIVNRTLTRSGVESANRGAHVLRHSLRPPCCAMASASTAFALCCATPRRR